MTPSDIRKLADADHDWLPRQYADVLRALADVVDALTKDNWTSAEYRAVRDALARVEAIKP